MAWNQNQYSRTIMCICNVIWIIMIWNIQIWINLVLNNYQANSRSTYNQILHLQCHLAWLGHNELVMELFIALCWPLPEPLLTHHETTKMLLISIIKCIWKLHFATYWCRPVGFNSNVPSTNVKHSQTTILIICMIKGCLNVSSLLW